MNNELSLDALLPAEMAAKAEAIGVKKAKLDGVNMFALAVLAGAFVAVGGLFASTVATGFAAAGWPVGLQRFLSGVAFCIGLILVVVGGAELFTGNNLIVMAWANHKVSTALLIRNWVIVYAGNFVGSVATALLMFAARHYSFSGGEIGVQALTLANTKAGYGFVQALALGILCNALVCLAVWLTYSARTVTDKILAIFFPITAFVAAGFEHSVANMYFLPMGLLIKQWADPAFWERVGKTPADFAALTWQNALWNLLPVTIGNIIGGALLVGGVYWFVYLRKRKSAVPG